MQNLTNFPLNYIAFVYTHIFLRFIEILLHVCRQKETWWCFTQTRNSAAIQSESCSVVSDSLRLHGLYSPWNSSGQNTGVHSLSLLQGILQPRDQTQASHNASWFFTSWATRTHHIAEEQCKQNIQNATNTERRV